MRILAITNEAKIDSAPGQRDALVQLQRNGWIETVDFISYKMNDDYSTNFQSVLEAVKSKKYDTFFVWSPKDFPATFNDFEKLSIAIGQRTVLYWEGDPWSVGGIKTYFKQMFWWARISTILFSVAGDPQSNEFKRYSSNVCLIPHTYCHIQFQKEEMHPPEKIDWDPNFIMIANQVATIPFLYGVPGSGTRFLLANRLKSKYADRFDLYGSNWPRWLNAINLKYSEQGAAIRKHSFSINWDNFPKYESYASDRLPIALISGRVHLTTKHGGPSLYGNYENGLIECNNPKEMMSAVESLMNCSPSELFLRGLQGHNWVKNRLSHRQAGQFMISRVNSKVPLPDLYPWNILK